jgi:hypothetical protein
MKISRIEAMAGRKTKSKMQKPAKSPHSGCVGRRGGETNRGWHSFFWLTEAVHGDRGGGIYTAELFSVWDWECENKSIP